MCQAVAGRLVQILGNAESEQVKERSGQNHFTRELPTQKFSYWLHYMNVT